jgi:DNA polymerase III subunit gamma/tau
MPLDLKYRPRRFADILGNQAVIQLLRQLSVADKLSERSLMFGGPKGCGKTSLARVVACAVVCSSKRDGEPCGECESCQGVKLESAENFEEFDAATQGSVDHMRAIVADLDYGNLSGKPSIYILDEAQRLTKQAQDALLKAVEERRLLVILCTTEPHKIQGPLRDRLTEFPISAPPADILLAHLQRVCVAENVKASDDSLRLIMQAQSNCPRTCLTALEILSSVGEVKLDDVREYFRFGATEKLVQAMEGLASNPRIALVAISELLDAEGPSWVCEKAILIIASAVRASVGAKAPIVVPGNTRGPAWLAIAKALGSLDKPTAVDVEVILLEAIPNLPAAPAVPLSPDWENRLSTISATSMGAQKLPSPGTVEIPSNPVVQPSLPKAEVFVPPPSPKTPEPLPKVSERRVVEPKSKELEIDGVKFTKDEKLTSVDDKLEKGSRGAPTAADCSKEPPAVRLDKDHEPMAPKEFARGFIKRIKGESPV